MQNCEEQKFRARRLEITDKKIPENHHKPIFPKFHKTQKAKNRNNNDFHGTYEPTPDFHGTTTTQEQEQQRHKKKQEASNKHKSRKLQHKFTKHFNRKQQPYIEPNFRLESRRG